MSAVLCCANCRYETPSLQPCPCGFPDCEASAGVCRRCARRMSALIGGES